MTIHKVLSRAGDGIEIEPLGDLTMKGISRPIPGFNLVSMA